MPRLVYGIGEGVESRTVYYSAWDRSLAKCPSCGCATHLESFAKVTDTIEYGVAWFKCSCGAEFKLGGLFNAVEV